MSTPWPECGFRFFRLFSPEWAHFEFSNTSFEFLQYMYLHDISFHFQTENHLSASSFKNKCFSQQRTTKCTFFGQKKFITPRWILQGWRADFIRLSRQHNYWVHFVDWIMTWKQNGNLVCLIGLQHFSSSGEILLHCRFWKHLQQHVWDDYFFKWWK